MPTECANPLLLGWLKEWWDEARERNSKGVQTYKKAHDSMKACPIAFSHPSEASTLKFIGPNICKRLTENLQKHCRDHGLPMPEESHKNKKRPSIEGVADEAPSKKPRKVKPYVPTLRSGPYAILMALSTLPETGTAGLTKTELVDLAQPDCDASFTAPSDPTKFYTAWNSMKTLQSKDFVYEFGRPTKRYALTEEGWDVAKRIRNAGTANKPGASTDDVAGASGTATSRPSERVTTAAKQPARKTSSKPLPTSKEAFRAPAAASFQNIDVIALDDDDDDEQNGNDLDGLIELPVFQAAPTVAPTKRGSALARSKTEVSANQPSHSLLPPNVNRAPSAPPATHSSPPSSPQRNKAVTSIFTPLRIPAGSFTIELVLDNREVRAKTDHEYIQNQLVTHDVVPTTRGLPLGDALWVARLKPECAKLLSAGGEDGTPNEIMLSHIMERKRLDDLIGSIKDGRFHEQKFRLRRSGIPNVTYLVEDITLSSETPQRTFDMIASAIAGTMTVNGFFVKRTRKLDDSIAYLARMTKLLRAKYANKPLNVVPSHALGDGRDPARVRDLLKDDAHFLTFDAFAAMAGKNDSLTLRDVFLKMLMCTRGITGDKAMEVQKHWKTPKEFVEALEKEEREGGTDGRRKRQEMVYRAAGQLVGKKQIGRAVSAKLCDIWGEA